MSLLPPSKTDDTDSFFRAFLADARAEADDYTVVRFGETPATADEGLKLVLAGVKRAMAQPAEALEADDGRVPEPDDHMVVTDGNGRPRCVLRVTRSTIAAFNSVDDDFAFDHGDVGQTREGWLEHHRALFSQHAERGGFSFGDDMPTAFIRFTVVWPRLFADDWKGPRLQ